MQNMLFVCSANKDRSKTADDYFSEKYPDLNFLSAGTNLKICAQLGTTPLEEDLLDWADKIFVMETKHAKFIQQMSKNKHNSKMVTLKIPDIYPYYDKQLIEILEEKMERYFL
jgi:predicted protein tyrosine phosphatase